MTTSPGWPVSLVIRDVRLVDGVADEPRDAVDVLVAGDRIHAVETHDAARPMPPDVRIVDGAGATLLPGLIDCHAHYTIDATVPDGFETFRHDPETTIVLRSAGMARRAIEAGVTTARSAGSPRNLDVVLRDAIERGDVPGPRLLAAGPALTITGGHGWLFGREADGEAEFVRAVRANVRDGADVIKVVSSEAAMLTTAVAGVEEMTQGEIEAVVREAERLRRRVLSHAQGSESVIRSARAGVASVEHAFLADDAALEVLAASGAFLVPTLVVTDVWHHLPDLSPAARLRQDVIEGHHRRSAEAAIALGIRTATGTDCGVRGVMPDMVAREVRLLNEHGRGVMDAIRSATAWAAELLGLDAEIGTVEVGKRADLLLVEGDPLADLRRLERVRAVVKAGDVVHAVAA
ncbi:MAG TPA: amidohydrolase family protein [Candidatus Limnocylindrales bacterium]